MFRPHVSSSTAHPIFVSVSWILIRENSFLVISTGTVFLGQTYECIYIDDTCLHRHCSQ